MDISKKQKRLLTGFLLLSGSVISYFLDAFIQFLAKVYDFFKYLIAHTPPINEILASIMLLILVGYLFHLFGHAGASRGYPILKSDPWFHARYALIDELDPYLVNFLFRWPAVPIFTFSLVAVIIVYLLGGKSPIVWVTAFYASFLFMNGLFRSEVPLLDIKSVGPSIQDAEDSDYTEKDKGEVLIYQVEIRNTGSISAEAPNAKVKLFNRNGVQIGSSKTPESLKDETAEIKLDEPLKVKFSVRVGEEISSEEEYFAYFVVTPSPQHRFLAKRKLLKFSAADSSNGANSG